MHRKIKGGTLELSQLEVQRNPLLNHKGNGVAAVVIYADSDEDKKERLSLLAAAITTLQWSSRFKNLFDQLELTANERKTATKALVSIAPGAGIECLIAEAQTDKAFLQDSNEIIFSDKDMEVGYPDHRRPLYLANAINQIPVKRNRYWHRRFNKSYPAQHTASSKNTRKQDSRMPMEVIGFGGKWEYTAGHIQSWLKVGPIASLARFHVVKMEFSYHILLGRPWLHMHHLIPSTYHQCVKRRLNGKMKWIATKPSPFKQAKAHLIETMFYDE